MLKVSAIWLAPGRSLFGRSLFGCSFATIHPVLGFGDVHHDLEQIVFRVNKLDVPALRPDFLILDWRGWLTQNAGRVGFELIANTFGRIARRHGNMDVIRSRGDSVQ